ncbi:caspase family protein [Ensifer soli]|uniref:caspase family protein n=1 Tax=Ciceribacter sp. sgz301302 TaxID=3342379 RepID=UPI0035B7E06E
MLRRLLLCLGLAMMAVLPAKAATFALVVGIDDYPHDLRLDGAAEDARDVATALRTMGVDDIITLTDGEATKDAIRTAWIGMVGRSLAGDTLIFHYAGHGAQMPELVPGDELDGLDEFLQLPGFDRSRAAETSREIIVDNELNAWFSEADAKGVQVLFVSDSCHSGGMSRSFSGKSRLAPAVTIKLPAPSAEAVSGATVKESGFRQVTVLAASLESQQTPEVVIDGKPRGALSWSFARAVEGAADRDGDGRISRIELEDYVFATVKSQSEALQVPNFTPAVPRSQGEVVVSLAQAGESGGGVSGEGAASVSFRQRPVADAGWSRQLALTIEGSQTVPERVGGSGVPYRWDAVTEVVYTPNGDVAAEHVGPAEIQEVVDKFILLDFLKVMASNNPGAVSLSPEQDIYASGTRLAFDAPATAYKGTLVFNLANTGEVQLLDLQDGGKGFSLSHLEVTKPFGADHLVVLSTNEPLDAIGAAMGKGVISPAALLDLLLARLDGTDTMVAIQPLYTRERL